MNNQMTPAGPQKLAFSAYVNSPVGQNLIRKAISDKREAARFATAIISAVSGNKNLQACKPESIISVALQGTALNFPPSQSTGMYYIVPYKDTASFILGYKGMIQLAIRTGQYKRINAIDVREGELVSWDPFTEELELDIQYDSDRERRKPIGYAGMFELVNGFRKTVYWSREKIVAHGKRFSKSFNRGPWQTDFDAMAKKTVIRDLLGHWGVMSVDFAQAMDMDEEETPGDDVAEAFAESVDVIESEGEIIDEEPLLLKAETPQVAFDEI